MSPYLYRRLMHEKLARSRQDAGPPLSHTHGAHRVSLLALKAVAEPRHISDPNLGGGARFAQATREEGPINSTTTQEVER